MFPTRSLIAQHIVLLSTRSGPKSRRGQLNFCKFAWEQLCARSPILGRRGRLGGAEFRVDFRLNTPRSQCRQAGLGSTGFELVADLETPFPDIRFGSRHDRVFNASVNHCVFSIAEEGPRDTFSALDQFGPIRTALVPGTIRRETAVRFHAGRCRPSRQFPPENTPIARKMAEAPAILGRDQSLAQPQAFHDGISYPVTLRQLVKSAAPRDCDPKQECNEQADQGRLAGRGSQF